jgi:ubiquitin carboxyl-terminal hydrolase L5
MRSEGNEADSSQVWFANQVPDYACASVALLNIVNNIPGLKMGKELRDFKEFTKDMDPLTRGDTIDNFDFVKRIHNSFASQNDLLNADAVAKDKFNKWKKKQAAAKGRATRAANKAEKETMAEASASAPARTTGRSQRQPALQTKEPSKASKKSMPAEDSGVEIGTALPEKDPESEYNPKSKANGTAASNEDDSPAPRRSGRVRKPARNKNVMESEAEEDSSGHHFVAYVPIDNHVWMLDGLNSFPQDLGSFGIGQGGADGGTGDWMDVASTDLMIRMVKGGDDYSCMAIVEDPLKKEKDKLAENVKTLQAIDTRLDSLDSDWREMEGGETKKEVVTGISELFGLSQADVDEAQLADSVKEKISSGDDILALLEVRKITLKAQQGMRMAVQQALMASQDLETEGVHLRHDYGSFVRSWVNALADQGLLADLVSG